MLGVEEIAEKMQGIAVSVRGLTQNRSTKDLNKSDK